MAADDVKELSDAEFLELSRKLQNGLRQDIARIYSDSIFCDLELVVGSSSFQVNCCVLQGRASRLYAQLCCLQKNFPSGCELTAAAARRLKGLLKDIYEKDQVKDLETLLVKDLQEVVSSPDYDQYSTPLISPSEIFKEERIYHSSKKSNSLYYSLVPLDWEKELEEQDFLIQSFCSIQKKEQKKDKENRIRPSFAFHRNKRKQKDSKSLQDLKKAVEEDYLLLQEEGALSLIDVCQSNLQASEILEIIFQKSDCSAIHHHSCTTQTSAESTNECGFFDAEETSDLCNDSLNDMIKGISDKSKMSSTMDTGPDSGLATSAEDIPLDQECALEAKSISSSVSSDCCVWDISTPQQTNLNSWVDRAPHRDNSGIQADFVDRVLEELVGKSQQQKENTLLENVTDCSTSSSVANIPKHGFFIDASTLLDETEIQPSAALELVVKEPSCLEENTNVLPSERGNRFETYLSKKGNSFSFEDKQKIGKSSDHQRITPQPENDIHEDILVSPLAENVAYTPQTYTSADCMDEGKPPSLIRSNTFELETEDDRLAILRQEYERRQGSLIFQRCVSQSSGPLSDAGLELDQNQHCTSLILPDVDQSLSGAQMSMFLTHMVVDDIQTPDSLNSDVPEVTNQEKPNAIAVEVAECVKRKDDVDIIDMETVESLPSDLNLHLVKEVSSPIFSRRKTESAPILSGAAPPLSPEKKLMDRKIKNPLTGSFSSAWVVDISDITKSPETRRKKAELPVGASAESQAFGLKGQTTLLDSRNSSSGLGFFIDLKDSKHSQDDPFGSIPSSEGSRISRQSSDSGKGEKQNACEFFVDLNQHKGDTSDHKSQVCEIAKDGLCPEKKLFSMFIDIGGKVPAKPKPELTSRLKAPLSPFSSKRRSFSRDCHPEGMNGRSSSTETEIKRMVSSDNASSQSSSVAQGLDQKKNRVLYKDSASPLGNRRTASSPRSTANQNCFVGKDNHTSRHQHVRANSLSFTKKCGGTNVSELSSSSIISRGLSSQSLQGSEIYTDEGTVLKPMFSSCHVSLPLDELQRENHPKSQEEIGNETSEVSSHRTVDSNESSLCSLETYSVHTPEQSSATDDCSLEKKDCSKNKDIAVEVGAGENSSSIEENVLSCSVNPQAAALKESSSTKVENQFKEKEAKSFVRLSDLDKEPIASLGKSAPSVVQRMSRSIPETSWVESKLFLSHSTGGGSATMSSSSRSLSRLFPNLSLNNGNTGRSKTSSICSALTEDLDAMRSSQVSDISSMQSSAGLECSTESTDLSSNRGSPATQLGDDLLKMFLEEINTDVIVEVGGRRIKAHKCILSSRCQYFAAILSGGWVESAGNVISLQGFSYTCVHFALCHIYSGASTIPDQISIVELANLADVLSLEGLKDVIMHTLKVKYCHFFHKPCAVCSVGVLECLPLAAAYGLDDIYRKSLRWITKYFVRIWPTKTFTTLPRELIDKCYQQHVIHMTADNVLETVLCCDKLLSTIPSVRWAEPVFVLTSRLLESCIKYISENFNFVLSSENFLSLGREVPWNVSRFQETLTSACERMPPDQSCRSYAQLCNVLDIIQGPDPPPEMTWHPSFVELLIQLRDLSEHTLIRQAVRAARTPGWGQMPTELRRKVQDAACLVLAPADQVSSRYKRSTSDGVRQSGQRSSYSRNLDLHQVKMAMVQHARRTNSSDYQHTVSTVAVRRNPPADRSATVTRRSAPVTSTKPAGKSGTIPSQGRPKTWPAQVKSRYLEKRPSHNKQTVEAEKQIKSTNAPVPQRRAPVKGILISSSDSSRNSSPAMKRSSNVSSSSGKTGASSSKVRASSVTVSSSFHIDATKSKDDVLRKNNDKATCRSFSVNDKQHFPSESSKTLHNFKKIKDSSSSEPSNNPGTLTNPQSFKDDVSNLRPIILDSQSKNLTLSNDSLATVSVSSCDETNFVQSEKDSKSKYGTYSKTKVKSASKSQTDAKKDEVRTPLSLANRKAPSFDVQKKSGKSHDPPYSLLPKRSVSQVVKSPIQSYSSSRLAIPLRTSRSVSSVPERGHVKANSFSETSVNKKPAVKDQISSNSSALSKRASTGSSSCASTSLAGKVSSLKNNKVNVSGNRSGGNKNTDKINGDSSLENNVHPTVGPRSGTFLKDEPTILKTPIVENS